MVELNLWQFDLIIEIYMDISGVFWVSPRSGRWRIDCERTTHVRRKI
jgi:hypothetical protein